MEISQLELKNIGPFKALDLQFPTHASERRTATVFIGNNGAGKTYILRAIVTALSWFIARLRSHTGKGSPILENDIHIKEKGASITLDILDTQEWVNDHLTAKEDYVFTWTLSKTRKGADNTGHRTHLEQLQNLVDDFKHTLSDDSNFPLPLIVYYSTERTILDIPLRIRGRHSFEQLDGYDNALTAGIDFRRFFEWFRQREDAENEVGIPDDIFYNLLNSAKKGSEIWSKLQALKASAKDRQLTAVREALQVFMPNFKNLRVKRESGLQMVVDKDDTTFNVAQLSQGEKCLMALVGDIARRLAMMNPGLKNPLHGFGIVLIDEVDLHLHPKWQRGIVDRLTRTFPNCQFILTTHSPLVISDTDNITCYSLNHGEVEQLDSQYGLDANQVLKQAMDTACRAQAVDEKLMLLLRCIQNNNISRAKRLLTQLEAILSDDHIELVKARLLLKKLQLKQKRMHE